MAKYSYQIQALDKIYEKILPSDLTLHNNLHMLCFLFINETINIYSLADIIDDRYFRCTEFSYLNENIKIGFLLYTIKENNFVIEDYLLYHIDKKYFNDVTENDEIFDSFSILNEYKCLCYQLKNRENSIESNRLKQLYISKPIFNLKRNSIRGENKWVFLNIFNEYFCYCTGINCLKRNISQNCKYYFYLYLIDKNKNVYEKTDFLLMDFIFKRYTTDDVFPIFEGMINKNLSAHYMTENEEIYEKYCKKKNFCDLIIHADDKSYKINDNFLERHFTLILKLRQVISSVGVNINFINNLFYNIDYISYICVGHGVSFFKYYLYNKYYGPSNFDKLLIPDSNILISPVLENGWKDENLIKLNLPRWERYNSVNKFGELNENSIFIMFTWREIKNNCKISPYYIKNIIKLLNAKKLIKSLIKHNITLYFTLHHKMLLYKKKFEKIEGMQYIEENKIAECLSKTKLIITDYSSIIFDMIYQKKPYIIFIPDAKDPTIQKNYFDFCYKIINQFKYNDFKFENIFFDIKSTINKIIYYIDNDFKIDRKLRKQYYRFNFTKGPIIDNFINILLNIKSNSKIY